MIDSENKSAVLMRISKALNWLDQDFFAHCFFDQLESLIEASYKEYENEIKKLERKIEELEKDVEVNKKTIVGAHYPELK